MEISDTIGIILGALVLVGALIGLALYMRSAHRNSQPAEDLAPQPDTADLISAVHQANTAHRYGSRVAELPTDAKLLQELVAQQAQANKHLESIRGKLTPVAIMAWMSIIGGGLWLLVVFLRSATM